MENNQFDMFGMFDTEIKEVKKETKKEETKKETKKANKKISPSPVVEKKDPNKEIEEKFKDYEKIIVKVFSNEVFSFEGADKENLKLEELTTKLIEGDYPELAEGIKWHLSSSLDKKTGILFAVGNFYVKG